MRAVLFISLAAVVDPGVRYRRSGDGCGFRGSCPAVGISVSALIMSSAAGMPGAIAVRSCGVQRAAVYQRRRPERTVGW